MHKRKTNLQRHRLQSFKKTLEVINQRIETKIKFLEDYSQTYHMPVMLTRKNLQQLRQLQKAANTLKGIEISQI